MTIFELMAAAVGIGLTLVIAYWVIRLVWEFTKLMVIPLTVVALIGAFGVAVVDEGNSRGIWDVSMDWAHTQVVDIYEYIPE